ncbi:MAG TPA: DMT family transporter [Xanthomonadaceae bacterium]|nr:DMT family transporter [Xanthomonadaceae bacterium]
MALHQASGRWRLGLVLALTTAGMWATLPVALKIALEQLDALTLTWFRFLVAALLVGAWVAWRGRLGDYRRLGRGDWLLLALAALMLIGNYVLYLVGLDYTTAANAQLIIQLAPLLMAVGGIVVFGERFSKGQWLGLAVLCAGMAVFFRDQLATLGGSPRYVVGALLIVAAAVVWAVYALAQKQLLRMLSSPAIMLFIYAAATVVLLPVSEPSRLLQLDGLHWLALLYCALNTLGAYGAFAEALEHWEASRVSVVLALTPLLTMAVVIAGHALAPQLVAPEHIGALGIVGALMVVAGSVLTSLLGRRRRPPVVVAPCPEAEAETETEAEPGLGR